MRLSVVTILAGLLAMPVNAEVYRWTDEQGNVHFGDRPPTAKQVEEVKINKVPTPVPGSDPASRLQKQQKLLNAYREERVKEAEARREAAEERQEHKRRCMQARNDLIDYERSSGIYDLDDDGKRVYMSDAERNAFIEKLRNDIRRYCS